MNNANETKAARTGKAAPTKAQPNLGKFALLSVDEFFAVQDGRAQIIQPSGSKALN